MGTDKHTHTHTHTREHSLGLDSRVVWTKPLKLLHFLLHGEHLSLELGPQRGERVPNVIGQRLIKGPLEVGCAHPVGKVTIGIVTQKELSLIGHGSLDVLTSVNVLLATVHHTNVACSDRVQSTIIKPVLCTSKYTLAQESESVGKICFAIDW